MRPSWGLVALVAACTTTPRPTPTGTVCPDPDPNTLTWDNFGKQFMTDYCTWCHDYGLLRSMRNGAPLYHNLETLEHTLDSYPPHIDQQAGSGPDADNTFMPGRRCPSERGGPLDRDCPQPTEQQRQNLSLWLACEVNRPHDFRPDAGVDAP